MKTVLIILSLMLSGSSVAQNIPDLRGHEIVHSTAFGQDVQLLKTINFYWLPQNSGPIVRGYYVKYGKKETESSVFSEIEDVGNNLDHNIDFYETGQYHLALSAYNNAGQSDNSGTLEFVIEGLPQQNIIQWPSKKDIKLLLVHEDVDTLGNAINSDKIVRWKNGPKDWDFLNEINEDYIFVGDTLVINTKRLAGFTNELRNILTFSVQKQYEVDGVLYKNKEEFLGEFIQLVADTTQTGTKGVPADSDSLIFIHW